MKRKVAKMAQLRLSPNEEAQLIKEEHERRRKLRLQQVREQERYIALQIRKEVQQRRDRELQNLAEELHEEWQRQQREKLQTVETLYQESLKAVGEGHRSAKENEPDWEAVAQKAEEHRERAIERHREALKELKSRRQRQQEEQTRHIHARRKAMLVEKERAAKVAGLPPPPPEPFQKIEAKRLPLVKVSDVDHFSVTHFHMPETAVDHEGDTEQVDPDRTKDPPDARQAAEEEARRLEELGKEEEQDRKERLAKAKLRGDCALRKERINLDRERLLQELARMQQADLQRRRQAVAQMPPQTFQPFYSRQEMREDWQRDLEFAFEDMYAGERRMKGDLVLHLVPEPLPTMSSNSHDDDLNVTLEPDVVPSAEQHSDDHRFPQPSTSTQVPAEPAEGAPRHALKKLLNKIRTQRTQWSSRSEGETAAEAMTIETGSLGSEDRGGRPPSIPPHAAPPRGHESSEESVVAGTLLLPQEHAAKIGLAEAERRKREEELEQQKQEQIALLQQLEEQRRSLELHLQQAHLEKGRAQAAEQEESEKHGQQEVPAQEQEVPPAVNLPPEEPQSSAAEDGDEHSRRVRQYQQRLLEQHRQHKQSVEEARHHLEEYQRVLKRYPSALTATLSLAGSQNPHPQAKAAVPRGPQVPIPPFLAPLQPAGVPHPGATARFPLAHWHMESSDTSVTSLPQSDVPLRDPCGLQQPRPVLPAESERPPLDPQPPLQPEPVPDCSQTEPTPLVNILGSVPTSPLPGDTAPPVSPPVGSQSPFSFTDRQSPAPPVSPGPKASPWESEVEAQRQELQEAQLHLERQKEAFHDQQRAQQQALLQQQSQLREQMRRQREALDALLSNAQPPQPSTSRPGLEVSRTDRLSLMSTLLRAIEESHSSLAPSWSTDPLPHSSVPANQIKADSLGHISLSSDPGSQSDPRSRTVPLPRAAKPPLARPRLGLLEMMEQHELSAIQEVETPVNASLAAAGEELEPQSSSSSSSSTLTEEPDVSEIQSASRGSGSRSGSGHSGRLSWRERLLLDSGSSPEADPVRASALISTSYNPCVEQGGIPLQCSEERYPLSSTQTPGDPECLSSMTISTGSFSTTEPDFNSTVVDASLPSADTEGRAGALASVWRRSISDVSAHTSPTSEASLHSRSIQRIIDKYTKELNDSLGAAGSFAAPSVERDVSALGGESSISLLLPSNQVKGVERQSQVSGPDRSSVLSGQETSISKLCDSRNSLHLQDTHGGLSSRWFMKAVEDGSFSEGAQNSSCHFLPLDPSPDFDSSSSSSQRSERQGQIRRAEERDPVSRMSRHPSDQSSSMCEAVWRDGTLSQPIPHPSHPLSSQWLKEGLQSVGSFSDDPSLHLTGEWGEVPAESSGGRVLSLCGTQAGAPALLGVSAGPSLHSTGPDSTPPLTQQQPQRNAEDTDGDLHETGIFHEIPSERTLGLQDPAEGESTLVDPTSDSFHPLLVEVTQNETADYPTTFLIPEEVQCSTVSQEGGAQTCATEGPPSPEQLRAEQPDPSLHPPAPLQDSVCRLGESLSVTPDSVLAESLVTEDLLLAARRLSGLNITDVTLVPLPPEGVCSPSGPSPHEGGEALVQNEPATTRTAPDQSISESKDSLPPWERILEVGSEVGILEEPELTFMNLTQSTVQELSVDNYGEEEEEEEEEANSKRKRPLRGEDLKSPSLAENGTSTKDEPVLSHAVMLLEFESSPGDLQQAFLQRRQDFIQRSAKRLEDMRARRAETRSLPHVTWPKSSSQSQPSHSKSQPRPPASGGELKKVGEVRVCTPEHRKMEEAEMHQRTERLYNQLEEVRRRKEMKSRQESYAKNREKAKEFQKKTLQKLRAKRAQPRT